MLTTEIKKAANDRNIDIQINQLGSMFSIFFTKGSVEDHANALTTDKEKYAAVFNCLLKSGVLLPPSAYETCFVSKAHKQVDMMKTINAFKKAFDKILRKKL